MVDSPDTFPEQGNLARNLDSIEKVVLAGDGDQILGTGDGVVRVNPPTSGTTLITLPGLMASKGLEFFIWSDGNDTGTVTIEEQGDGMVAFADVILTVDKDRLLVKNVAGKYWKAIDVQAT